MSATAVVRCNSSRLNIVPKVFDVIRNPEH